MRERLSSTLPIVVLVCSAFPSQAQDGWESVVRAASSMRAPDCFILVSSPPVLQFNWYGADPLAEADLRELRRVTLEEEPARAIARIKDGAGWALFNPKGERVSDGSGVPNPARIRESMEQAGWKPLRESLQEHLKRHPGDGQAQVELTFLLARHGRDRKYAGTLSKAWVERLSGDLIPTLRALADTPDLPQGLAEARPQPFGPTLAALWVAELDQDPGMGDAIRRLFAVVPPQISRDPENQILWTVLDFMRQQSKGTEDSGDLLASLEGVPGRPWPPIFLGEHIRSWYRKEPVQLAAAASDLMAQNLKADLVAHLGRPQVIQTLETWGELRLEGLLLQGQFDEALAYIGWIRIQAGKSWLEVSAKLTKDLHLVKSEENSDQWESEIREFPLSTEKRASLQASLSTEPLPDQPLPTLEPLRLVLLNGDSMKNPWEVLRRHPTLVAWDATELSWAPLTPVEAECLRNRYAWPSGPRWVLLQGEQVLTSQAGFPKIQTLENAMWAQGASRLEFLSTWIKTHPDRVDARSQRINLIRPRLPNPTLERIFLQDLEALEAAPGPLNFQPDLELWGPVARRIVSRLSERIFHWPFHERTWKAYVDWAGLMPALPRPDSVLATLETFPYQLGAQLPGPLPAPVSLAVVEALSAQNRFLEVDAWMHILWERGLKSWLSKWASMPPLPKQDSGGWLDRAAPEVQRMISDWGGAMRNMGRTQELKSLRWELESMRPGLGSLLGRGGQ